MLSEISLRPQPNTDGLVFNRKDPHDVTGEVQLIVNRHLKVQNGVHNYIANKGKDITSPQCQDRLKFRIPATSVVNKVGDCGCLGLHLTAAQWIWLLNLLCFLTHTGMVFATAYFAWWSKDLKKYGDNNPYQIKIYRVSARWNNLTTEGYDYTIEDNGMPIDIAWGTIAFYAISAIFHLCAVVTGLFDNLWFWYWR